MSSPQKYCWLQKYSELFALLKQKQLKNHNWLRCALFFLFTCRRTTLCSAPIKNSWNPVPNIFPYLYYKNNFNREFGRFAWRMSREVLCFYERNHAKNLIDGRERERVLASKFPWHSQLNEPPYLHNLIHTTEKNAKRASN